MKAKSIIYRLIPPCKKCPYKLGQVHTMVNPCPQCKTNGYEAYERFKGYAKGSDGEDDK